MLDYVWYGRISSRFECLEAVKRKFLRSHGTTLKALSTKSSSPLIFSLIGLPTGARIKRLLLSSQKGRGGGQIHYYVYRGEKVSLLNGHYPILMFFNLKRTLQRRVKIPAITTSRQLTLGNQYGNK